MCYCFIPGANDVSMIQMADVGVGISGQEGRQAVMASDYAMGQFRFLKKLLLVHGHWNYERLGYMVLYNFYRNAVFVMMLFWYTPNLLCAYLRVSVLNDNFPFCINSHGLLVDFVLRVANLAWIFCNFARWQHAKRV